MESKEINILRALGIIYVVMGHGYYFLGKFLHPYSFHMALFFFISGYLYIKSRDLTIARYSLKKIKTLIIPYFIFNAIFFGINVMLKCNEYNLGSNLSLYTFFIQPFVNGHQNLLYLSAWFMPQLFITLIVFKIIDNIIIKTINKNKILRTLIFCIIGVMATLISKYSDSNNILIIIERTLFSLFFVELGVQCKENDICMKEGFFTVNKLCVAIITEVLLIGKYDDIAYELVWGNFKGHIFLPYVTSIIGIYIMLFIVKGISKYCKDNSIIEKIGKNTMYIMIFHLSIFFTINFLLMKLGYVNKEDIKNNIWYIYNPNQWGIIYIIISILSSVYIGEILKVMKKLVLIKKVDQIELSARGGERGARKVHR